MRIIFTSIFFSLILLACNFKSKDSFAKYRQHLRESIKTVDSIPIDTKHKPQIIKVSNTRKNKFFYLDIEFIPLETRPKALIGRVGKIQYDKGKIFILDNKFHSLFIFSREGRFLNKIHNVGNGPSEYNKLSDFALNREKKTIVLYDSQKKKYFFHNYKGKYQKSKSFGFWFKEFTITDSGNFVLYTNNGNRSGNKLFLTDSTGTKITEKGLPAKNYYKLNYYSSTPNINKFKNNIIITFPFLNKIYSYNNKKIICKYQLDLRNNAFKYNPKKHLNIRNFTEGFKKSNKHYIFLGSFFEGSKYSLIGLLGKEKYKTVLLNKETGKQNPLDLKIPNHDYHFPFPHTRINDKYLTYTFPHDLISQKIHKDFDSLNNIQENDNPCLVLFSIKTD